MLLFGKKSFLAAPSAVADRLRAVVTESRAPGLSQAREWLVFAGQLEQAVVDREETAGVTLVTDRAATLFLDVAQEIDAGGARTGLCAALAAAADELSRDAAEFRLPEGFAWYALYPDAYAITARRWAREILRSRVCVIGLRSIGTSLSALVAEALRRAGCDVAGRLTIRPSGHPFRREAALPVRSAAADAFIIVDEGPGLSGSSMASAAEALLEQGVREEAIVFFPGHGNGPGGEASAAIRRWWTRKRCWVAGPDEMFSGRDHASAHAAQGQLFGGFAAANGSLETLAALKQRRQQRLAHRGFALNASVNADGWLTIPDSGTPLQRSDFSFGVLEDVLAPYIAEAAMPGDDAICHDAIRRTAEALACHAGESAAALAERAARETGTRWLAGDGRLGPAEWTRLSDGRILKRNATGTDFDHTWQGQQPLMWDVAGAAAEWEMTDEELGLLVSRLERALGPIGTRFAIAFHKAGYCCLQLARARDEGNGADTRRHAALLAVAMERMQAFA